MAIPQPICTRLAPPVLDEIDSFIYDHGYGPSAGLRRIVEEWVALNRFPLLEFRSGLFGRRAALRGGPEAWEIVSVWQRLPGRTDEVYRHFGWLEREAIRQALDYYQDFPADIDEILRLNERVALRTAE